MELKSKSEVMQAVVEGRAMEAFEHSVEGWFDVSAMRAWAERHLQPVMVPVNAVAPFLTNNRVIDPERVSAIPLRTAKFDPALCVEYPNPNVEGGIEHLFIDGTHRAVKLQQAGVENMLVYMIPSSAIIRPAPGWGTTPDHDWGDKIENGNIIKRT